MTTSFNPTPEDPTGEIAAKTAFESTLEEFDALLTKAFSNDNLTNDDDLVDSLVDELHEKIDTHLTAYFDKSSEDDLDVDAIEDEAEEDLPTEDDK